MWSFRFLPIKEPAQKKQTSCGNLFGVFIPTGSYGNLDSKTTFIAVRPLYRNGMCKMFVSCQPRRASSKEQTGIVIYFLTWSLNWVCLHDCLLSTALGKQTNKHGEISCFSPRMLWKWEWEKVEGIEKVITGVGPWYLSVFFSPLFAPCPPHKHLCIS